MLLFSVADSRPGCGIRFFYDPWIQDTDPGWKKIQIQDPGSGIGDEHPGSYFLEHRISYLG